MSVGEQLTSVVMKWGETKTPPWGYVLLDRRPGYLGKHLNRTCNSCREFFSDLGGIHHNWQGKGSEEDFCDCLQLHTASHKEVPQL